MCEAGMGVMGVRGHAEHSEERRKNGHCTGSDKGSGMRCRCRRMTSTRGGWLCARQLATKSPEVSILIGVGAGHEVGCMPAAKVSMMIMRPPQRGQGHGNWC